MASPATLGEPFRRRRLCRECDRPLSPWGTCRRRACPGYGPIWAEDWRHLLMRCLLQLHGVALLTVTAPGQDYGLVWDRSRCTHPASEHCSGPKGCRVVQEAADAWHSQVEAAWSRFHRVAAQIARRLCGPGPLVAARVWETQERGVLHLHIVVPYSTLVERARAKEYVAALNDHRGRHGFGFVQLSERLDGENGGVRAAGYCAKYVGKAAGAEMAVRRPVYIGSFLTQAVGLTMRLLRWRRHIWHAWGFRAAADELRPFVAFLQAIRSLQALLPSVQPNAP